MNLNDLGNITKKPATKKAKSIKTVQALREGFKAGSKKNPLPHIKYLNCAISDVSNEKFPEMVQITMGPAKIMDDLANSVVVTPSDPYIVPSNNSQTSIAPLANFKILITTPAFDNQGNLLGIENFIDVAARDLAEAMAPMPSFNCSATNMVSDAQRKAADIRTRIANYYVAASDLPLQMYSGADWFNWF